MKRIARTLINDSEVFFAFWEKNELKVGIGPHIVTFDGRDAERVWALLGGEQPEADEPKENAGRWK